MLNASETSWPEVVAHAAVAHLPPVRDDEPTTLRRDILDELTDHLACAFRRELLKTKGERERAEHNVRQRFGDPAKVARRLWLDAMKGRLMTQKVLIGTCAALVVASFAFYTLMWQAIASSQERNALLAAQSQAANAQMLAEAQNTNAALLARLEDIGKASAFNDPQWNPVTLRLTSSDGSAPFRSDVIKVVRVAEREQGGKSWEFWPTAEGVVDCGLMQPGKYTIYLESTWGEGCYRSLTVMPGRSIELTISCPTAPPKSIPIDWNIDWPENLASYENYESSWLLVSLGGRLVREFGEDTWTDQDGGRILAFHPDGRMLNLSTVELPADVADLVARSSSIRSFLQDRRGSPPIVEANEIWAGGRYSIGEMAYAEWNKSQGTLSLLQDTSKPAIDFGNDDPGGITGGKLANLLTVTLPEPSFVAPKSEQATWTIKMPSGLIEWAKLRHERQSQAGFGSIDQSALYPLFSRDADAATERGRMPIEAPRPRG